MMTSEQFAARLSESTDWLAREFAAIRTGQAAPALLDNVKVDSYGSLVPLNQVSSVGIEDARTLRITPWDVSQIAAIESTLREADLGVSVSTDSAGLRVIFPELTSERREQLTKLAKQKLEDARVSVRAARDEIMKALEQQEKDGDLSEDEKFGQKEAIQKQVDSTNQSLDELYKAKETELAA
jgi:ribosome recycling factor